MTKFVELQGASFPGDAGGLTAPLNPQLNFAPQYQLLSDGLDMIVF